MGAFKLLIASNSFGSCGADVFEKLSEAGVEYTKVHSRKILGEKELAELIPDYDGVVVGADVVSRTVIEAGKKLKIIAKHGVGLDNVDLEAAKEHGIAVTIGKNSNSTAVAELAIAMILNLARNLDEHTCNIRNKEWIRFKGLELSAATLGVAGTGSIGKEVIRRMEHFCRNILAYDVYPDKEFEKEHKMTYVSLDRLFEESDIITLHVPLLEETKGMICAETLEKMKTGAILVNTARGELADEEAVADALESGKLGGFGIDAFTQEPPWGSRLLQQKHIVMSPHMGAYTSEAINKMSRYAAESILEFIEGKPIKNRVV